VEHVTHEDYLSEDTKVKVKDFKKRNTENVLIILTLSYRVKMVLI
jgi:hypothetical protein